MNLNKNIKHLNIIKFIANFYIIKNKKKLKISIINRNNEKKTFNNATKIIMTHIEKIKQ